MRSDGIIKMKGGQSRYRAITPVKAARWKPASSSVVTRDADLTLLIIDNAHRILRVAG